MNKFKAYASVFAFVFCLNNNTASASSEHASKPKTEVSPTLRILLEELAYVGTDYATAVADDSKILDEKEYEEMQDFAASTNLQFIQLKSSLEPDIAEALQAKLGLLVDAVNEKKAPSLILQLCRQLVQELTLRFKVPVAPEKAPDLELGRRTYQNACASCHGLEGRGDGALGKDLDPPPRSFYEELVIRESPPFKFYNTLLTGIYGTGMRSYAAELTEEELWSVSFYLAGLRFERSRSSLAESNWSYFDTDKQNALLNKGLSKAFLANQSDADLEAWLSEDSSTSPAPGNHQLDASLAALRLGAAFSDFVPLKASSTSAAQSQEQNDDKVLLGLALSEEKALLAQQKSLLAASDLERGQQIEQALLEGYLLGFEKAEVALSLENKKGVKEVEGLFISARSQARLGANQALAADLEALLSAIKGLRTQYLRSKDSAEKNGGGLGEFFASFVIIVREGLEAFLVIAALLAILSSLGEFKARRWVHAGWLAALVCGGISYYLFESILKLSGAAKESIEAVCTGFAVVLLFYTGFWLLSQTEHKKWNYFVKSKSQEALSSGKLWGLFSVAFIAVYREAAETVLFYAALLHSAKSQSMISLGFGSGALLLFVLCWGMIRFNLKLPLRQFFLVTSCLMVAISIVLAGKTVRELVEAGHIQETPIGGLPVVDLLGIYPSFETLAAQALLLSLGLGAAYYVLVWKKATSP